MARHAGADRHVPAALPGAVPAALAARRGSIRSRYPSPVTDIPKTFRAYVAEKVDSPDGTASVNRGVREFAAADLPPGEVEIRVGWSSVNYKDGLATRADGKVARISPIIPGI